MNTTTKTYTGKVKFYSKSKAYGFIVDSETGAEIFVHITGIKGRVELKPEDTVSYELIETPKGLSAVEVEVLK